MRIRRNRLRNGRSYAGRKIGKYLVDNYNKLDLNGDGKISYVMFKGQEGNMEAIARTQYGVEDANKVLKAAGKPRA